MHSSGSMTRIRAASWMQSTGQTSTQERSLMSMQGSAMMYVTAASLYRRDQLLDHGRHLLCQRRLGEHPVEAGLVRAPEPGRVRVVREADDRHVGEGVGDLVRVDSRDVADDHVGRVDAVRGHEM